MLDLGNNTPVASHLKRRIDRAFWIIIIGMLPFGLVMWGILPSWLDVVGLVGGLLVSLAGHILLWPSLMEALRLRRQRPIKSPDLTADPPRD
jgi:hypothetical protein